MLRSGDHARVARWRRAQALRRTLDRRPDLLRGRALTADEAALLEEFGDDDASGSRRIPGLTSTFPDDGAPFHERTDLVDRAHLRTTSPTSHPATP